jgi:hypothetical protein
MIDLDAPSAWAMQIVVPPARPILKFAERSLAKMQKDAKVSAKQTTTGDAKCR